MIIGDEISQKIAPAASGHFKSLKQSNRTTLALRNISFFPLRGVMEPYHAWPALDDDQELLGITLGFSRSRGNLPAEVGGSVAMEAGYSISCIERGHVHS